MASHADEYPCLGTEDNAEIWCNSSPGMEAIVNVFGAYVLIGYAAGALVYFCLVTGDWARANAYVFLTFTALCVWSHVKTMLTDPGAVPRDAIAATEDDAKVDGFCAKCDRYKPSKAYHCSKCKRCVSRMDHHCPYTNNCVGAKNQKHMVLFLIYCNVQAVYALALVAYYGGYRGYLYDEGWLALALTALLGVDGGMTLLFTGTMCRRQVISMQTGIGTIDRLKLAKGKPIAGGTPIPLSSIFGHTVLFWPLPLDPDFPPEVDAEILGFRCPRVADEHREPLWRPVSQETGLLSGEERKEPA